MSASLAVLEVRAMVVSSTEKQKTFRREVTVDRGDDKSFLKRKYCRLVRMRFNLINDGAKNTSTEDEVETVQITTSVRAPLWT